MSEGSNEKSAAEVSAGWEALEGGDVDKARARAEAAVKLDGKSADARTLLGATLAAGGDPDRALEEFARAMQLDPEGYEPALLAAETAAGIGELERAIELSDEAIDRSEEEDEFIDALLLKAELQLGLDDVDSAAETLAELPPGDVKFPESLQHLRAAACLLEIEDLDGAEKHYQHALAAAPDSAEALHGLGLVAEAEGDRARMIDYFKKVRALDAKAPSPSWSLSTERIEQLAQETLAELPDRARELLANVPIVVEDSPSEALVDDGLDPRLLGLFTGVPYPEQSTLSGQAPHLEHILLFQKNLERDAHDEDEVAAEIRTTLLHETGHFFGLGEDDLEKLGLD